ncbi:hypothetical protein GGI21_005959, partial [Coemansia aciculifera]
MPDAPDEKPSISGTGGRGRGRGTRGASVTPAGALPSERLSSIRGRPQGANRSSSTPAVPAASAAAAATASTSSSSGGPSKMRFAPTVPVRRNKTELSALLAADKKPDIVKREPKFERGRGRGRGGAGGGRGGHHELVQVVTGPFAQGPASLGNSAARRNMGSTFLGGGGGGGGFGGGGRSMKPGGGLPGISGGGDFAGSGGGGGGMDVGNDDDEEGSEILLVTDHNEALAVDELAVQTEEMAIAAALAMDRLCLDTTMAELFTRSTSKNSEDDEDEDERMI